MTQGRLSPGDERRSCCCRPQGMDAPQIAEVTFTSADRVRDVIHNFNADGFDSLRPKSCRWLAPEVQQRAPARDHIDRAGQAR